MGSNLSGVQAGTELLLARKGFGRRNLDQEPRKVQVHKVGTKLVYIQDGTTATAYRIENGRSNSQYNDYELWRPEEWAAEGRRAELEKALNAHGVEVWRKQQPIRVLEKLLAVLDGEL
jgi:hypothetical protein